MSDEQLRTRMINKRMIIIALVLLVLSAGLLYYWFATTPDVQRYESQVAQEKSLKEQVTSMEASINQLRSIIDQAGKELISFSENKIKYINLASTLSNEYGVYINKLTVSDVWDEGQMSGMTTSIEVQGNLSSVQKFVSAYCDTAYTNRINVVSCRPIDRFPWVSRNIDGENVLTWFDLSSEQRFYDDYIATEKSKYNQAATEAGVPSTIVDEYFKKQEEEKEPITLAKIFEEKTFKVYLVIDFLGRQ